MIWLKWLALALGVLVVPALGAAAVGASRWAEAGPIDTVRAEARGRLVGGKASTAPWQGRFWNYALRDGMRIPLEGEVAWMLPEGAKTYWRGKVTVLSYEFAP